MDAPDLDNVWMEEIIAPASLPEMYDLSEPAEHLLFDLAKVPCKPTTPPTEPPTTATTPSTEPSTPASLAATGADVKGIAGVAAIAFLAGLPLAYRRKLSK